MTASEIVEIIPLHYWNPHPDHPSISNVVWTASVRIDIPDLEYDDYAAWAASPAEPVFEPSGWALIVKEFQEMENRDSQPDQASALVKRTMSSARHRIGAEIVISYDIVPGRPGWSTSDGT